MDGRSRSPRHGHRQDGSPGRGEDIHIIGRTPGSDLEEVIRGQIPGIYSASLIKGQTILNIQVL